MDVQVSAHVTFAAVPRAKASHKAPQIPGVETDSNTGREEL